MKNKLIAALIALTVVFGAGVWVGHWVIPQSTNVDPQTYFNTVFTPFEDGSQTYIDWLDKHARKSLYVADYTFNNDDVVNKYIELKTKYHSDVHVLLDLTESRAVAAEQPIIDKLRAAGIEVVVGTSPKSGAIMHNKYSIGDALWVEDGSWNYSDKADLQANTLNMNNIASPRRATMFRDTWNKLHVFMVEQTAKRDAKAAKEAADGDTGSEKKHRKKN